MRRHIWLAVTGVVAVLALAGGVPRPAPGVSRALAAWAAAMGPALQQGWEVVARAATEAGVALQSLDPRLLVLVPGVAVAIAMLVAASTWVSRAAGGRRGRALALARRDHSTAAIARRMRLSQDAVRLLACPDGEILGARFGRKDLPAGKTFRSEDDARPRWMRPRTSVEETS